MLTVFVYFSSRIEQPVDKRQRFVCEPCERPGASLSYQQNYFQGNKKGNSTLYVFGVAENNKEVINNVNNNYPAL